MANESNNTLITIKRTLLSLKKKNIIERHGANKNGYWIINENSLETISWKLGGNDAQVGGKLGGNNSENLSDVEKNILELLQKKPNLSQTGLANELNTPLRTIQRCIYSLKKRNIIERLGSKRNGYWIRK